jgi:hypothetical protein
VPVSLASGSQERRLVPSNSSIRSPRLAGLREPRLPAGSSTLLCRARATLRHRHDARWTDARDDCRSSLAAVTFGTSFRLLANKLLKLTAATLGFLRGRACARGTTPRARFPPLQPRGLLMRPQLNSGTLGGRREWTSCWLFFATREAI